MQISYLTFGFGVSISIFVIFLKSIPLNIGIERPAVSDVVVVVGSSYATRGGSRTADSLRYLNFKFRKGSARIRIVNPFKGASTTRL
jgi:hypothetical protein